MITEAYNYLDELMPKPAGKLGSLLTRAVRPDAVLPEPEPDDGRTPLDWLDFNEMR